MLQVSGLIVMTKEEFQKDLSAAARLGGNFQISDVMNNQSADLTGGVSVDTSETKMDTPQVTINTDEVEKQLTALVAKYQKQLEQKITDAEKQLGTLCAKINTAQTDAVKQVEKTRDDCLHVLQDETQHAVKKACDDIDGYSSEVVSRVINTKSTNDQDEISKQTENEALNSLVDNKDADIYAQKQESDGMND